MEIRLHGRGGQGGVTCAKILAAVYARLGKSVQTFGDYAGERSGAPVRAYTRVSERPIENRNKVYAPDHVLILDPTLLSPQSLQGLAAGGLLVINTPDPLSAFAGELAGYRLAVVDATAIARKHRIGTRSVVIVNTTIAGAFVRAIGLPMSVLEDVYQHLGLAGNLPAARDAYHAVDVREAWVVPATAPAPPPAADAHPVPAIMSNLEGLPTGLETGSWRSQTPRYAEHVAPCHAFCPAGNDVVGFIQTVATDGERAAASVLARTTPFASICGRVCPAPCMAACNRGEYDGAVNIRALERWIGDHAEPGASERHSSPAPRRIAIVGGGPAGLSAAYTLARAGHAVTVLERERALGGVLRTGIPAYRLPRAVLDREVAAILSLGVQARCGELLDRARVIDLAREHDAVILATGLQSPRALALPGAQLAGIEQGLTFLHRVNAGGAAGELGRVLVLGGGNTALECARSARRLGARHVTIAYRRTRAEMPAIREEIEQACEEGIELVFLRQPVGFCGGDRLAAATLAEVELGVADDTGRKSPVLTSRTHELPCDTVLLALGQSADFSLVPEGWLLSEGRFWRGSTPFNVFASGDFATGDGTVAHAIGDGRRVAGRVLHALGVDFPIFRRPDRRAAVPVTDIRLDHFATGPPAQGDLAAPAARRQRFAEVDRGLTNALEAHRCFACGHCTRCDTCLVYCPEGIIRRRERDYEVDYAFCKGCGICVSECPRKAIEMIASP
ncbi:MAG: FAD-dependent oxidoreductase [Planctomycetota bacterium]